LLGNREPVQCGVRRTCGEIDEAFVRSDITVFFLRQNFIVLERERGIPEFQRLVGEMKTMLVQMKEQGATVYDREITIVLRAIEQGAREIRNVRPGDTAYLDLVGRLLQVNRAAEAAAAHAPASSLIIP